MGRPPTWGSCHACWQRRWICHTPTPWSPPLPPPPDPGAGLGAGSSGDQGTSGDWDAGGVVPPLWGCCHTCPGWWVAHLPSGPVPREASKRENQSLPTCFGSTAGWQAGGHVRCLPEQGNAAQRPVPSTGPVRQGQGTQAIPVSLLASTMAYVGGGVTRSRAVRVCPVRSPGDGGQLLLGGGIYACSFHQQGEIKVYLYSGGFGDCKEEQ